jgi:hypothetical protein
LKKGLPNSEESDRGNTNFDAQDWPYDVRRKSRGVEEGEGEWVEKGEVLFVFETEKVTFEVEAPQSGFLQLLLLWNVWRGGVYCHHQSTRKWYSRSRFDLRQTGSNQ